MKNEKEKIKVHKNICNSNFNELPNVYAGNDPYIFISYKHTDKDMVFPVIKKLQDEFYRVWYDNGIKAGSDWNAYIEERIKKCDVFVAFFSKDYFLSEFCIKELEMARELEKPYTYVILDENLNKDSLFMYFFNNKGLSVIQGINKKDLLDKNVDIYSRLVQTDLLSNCRDAVKYDKVELSFYYKKKFCALLWSKKKLTIILGDKIIYCDYADYVVVPGTGSEFYIEEYNKTGIRNNKTYEIQWFDEMGTFKEGLCACKLNNKWGFIDDKGIVVKNFIYNDAQDFIDGHCIVQDKYGAYGIINKDFEYIIPPEYIYIFGGTNNLFLIADSIIKKSYDEDPIFDNDKKLCGIININNDMVLPIKYNVNDIFIYANDKIVVYQKNKKIVYDKNGKNIKVDNIDENKLINFRNACENNSSTSGENIEISLDTDFNKPLDEVMAEVLGDFVTEFDVEEKQNTKKDDMLTKINHPSHCFYLLEDGKKLTIPQYDEMVKKRKEKSDDEVEENLDLHVKDNIAEKNIKIEHKSDPLDILGKEKFDIIFPDNERQVFRFDEIGEFYEGLCKVCCEGKYGFINLEGKVVVEEKYDYVSDFIMSTAIVSIGTKYGLIDKNGIEIILPQYDSLNFLEDTNGHILEVVLNSKKGYILNPLWKVS